MGSKYVFLALAFILVVVIATGCGGSADNVISELTLQTTPEPAEQTPTEQEASDEQASAQHETAEIDEQTHAEQGVPQQYGTQQYGEYITIRGEKYCTSLTELWINDVGLTDEDIIPLRYMTNLRFLNLGHDFIYYWEDRDSANLNQVSDLTPLAGLINLESLVLDTNQISDLTPLAGLTNLWALNLSHNQISDLTPMSGLLNLEFLHLSENHISCIAPLAGLERLFRVYLDHNQISDFSMLSELPNLGLLFLDYNQISEIPQLTGFEHLGFLILDNNQISDITGLAGISLVYLSLKGNPISDWSPVEHVDFVLGRPVGDDVIYGEVYFNGIALYRVFTEPFLEVLGEPLGEYGVWFNFSGLTIMSNAPRGAENFENAVAIQVNISPNSLGMIDVNGMSLDNVRTRTDVIASFGSPYISSSSALGYRVISPHREYRLFFEYMYFDVEQYITTIRFLRI